MLHVTLTVLGKITMFEALIMNFFNFSGFIPLWVLLYYKKLIVP